MCYAIGVAYSATIIRIVYGDRNNVYDWTIIEENAYAQTFESEECMFARLRYYKDFYDHKTTIIHKISNDGL